MANLPGCVLVGGAPLSGKTSLSRVIASRLGMPHVSTDDLSTAIRAVTSTESQPDLHSSGVDGYFRDYYTSQTPGRLMDDAVAFLRAAWPAVEAVVRSRADQDRPAVIEGWGILPEFVAAIGLAKLTAVFLVPDESAYEHRCRANVGFWKGAADEEGLIRSFARRSILFGRMLDASASRHGLPVLRLRRETGLDETVDLALGLLKAAHGKRP